MSNRPACQGCRHDVVIPGFTMAFQPIYDLQAGRVHAYEALVRPPGGGTAAAVLAHINAENRYRFDQACRVKAIELAARLQMEALLSVNFLPNAVYHPRACLQLTFEAAHRSGFPLHHLMFEVTENELSDDVAHLRSIFTEYRRHGMITALDDFGAGHSGLSMLAQFQPDLIKIDMSLLQGVADDPVRGKIARAVIGLCESLRIAVVAEGIERLEDAVFLRRLGVRLFQGYLFARPQIEQLPSVPAGLCEQIEQRLAEDSGWDQDPCGVLSA